MTNKMDKIMDISGACLKASRQELRVGSTRVVLYDGKLLHGAFRRVPGSLFTLRKTFHVSGSDRTMKFVSSHFFAPPQQSLNLQARSGTSEPQTQNQERGVSRNKPKTRR